MTSSRSAGVSSASTAALTPNDRIIVSWDTALSARDLSSYSACVVAQVRGEAVYLLDVVRERLEYPDLKRRVIEVHRLWRHRHSRYALLIEDKGSGMSLIQDLIPPPYLRESAGGVLRPGREM
jgi:phage terminase large subunit-like protein